MYGGFYIFGEVSTNTSELSSSIQADTHENAASLPHKDDLEAYVYTKPILDKIFGENNYLPTKILTNLIIKLLITLINNITKSKTDESFVLLNNKCFQGISSYKFSVNKSVGIILKPTHEYTTGGKRIFEISYISVNPKYKFITEPVFTGSVELTARDSSGLFAVLDNSESNGKSKTYKHVSEFVLIRSK